MEYRFESLMKASAVICFFLAALAPADSCVKTLYIDGVYVDDAIATQGLTLWPYERITIGAEGDRWYLYNEYVGKMDEFAIYAGVLDLSRITAHYNARSVDYATYTAAVQADNPLLYLQFEDASTAHEDTAENTGSIGIDGQYISTGVGSITQTIGIATGSNAIVFPGAEPDAAGNCVDVWDGNGDFSIDLEGDVTIELWVNYTNISDWPRFFQHNSGGQGCYGVMVSDTNELGIIGCETTNYMTTPYDINDDSWHHVVVTYDSTYEIPPTGPYDEEVMADNPVLYIRFEEDDLCDYSGNNYWVDASGLVTIEKTSGSMGKAALLNGGWVAAAPNVLEPSLPTQYGHQYAFAPNSITYEFWLYTPMTVGDYAGIFSQSETKLSGNDALGRWAPEIARAGGTQGKIAFGDNRESAQDPTYDSWAYISNGFGDPSTDWSHYVIMWEERQGSDPNDANQIYFAWYRDDSLIREQVFGPPDRPDVPVLGYIGPEMDHILIGNLGSRDALAYNPYVGYIDEFAIYDVLLPRDRITAHYNAWQPRDCNELWDREMAEPWAVVDRNKDCIVDFFDFASFALEWALCNDPCDANCIPNW